MRMTGNKDVYGGRRRARSDCIFSIYIDAVNLGVLMIQPFRGKIFNFMEFEPPSQSLSLGRLGQNANYEGCKCLQRFFSVTVKWRKTDSNALCQIQLSFLFSQNAGGRGKNETNKANDRVLGATLVIVNCTSNH